MMSCAQVQDRLDDYVVGALPESEFQELERHLAECPRCRAQDRELRALLAQAAALPVEVAPARDLWPGIAARITTRGRVLPFRGRAWAWTLLAAAAAAVLALSLMLRSRGPAASVPMAAQPSPAVAIPAAAFLPADLASVELEYARAAIELRGALEARREALSPETLNAVDANLRVIDTALDQIREALHKDPANSELARMLRTTHKRKLEVLQRVAKLAT